MQTRRSLLRRLKLRTVLVVALLLSGIIPLGISSALLIDRSLKVLQDKERDNLTNEARSLSLEIGSYLETGRRQLTQLGESLVLAPGPEVMEASCRSPGCRTSSRRSSGSTRGSRRLRVLDLDGAGLSPGNLSPEVQAAMNAAFEQARTRKTPAYGFVATGAGQEPQVVLAVPVPARLTPADRGGAARLPALCRKCPA